MDLISGLFVTDGGKIFAVGERRWPDHRYRFRPGQRVQRQGCFCYRHKSDGEVSVAQYLSLRHDDAVTEREPTTTVTTPTMPRPTIR